MFTFARAGMAAAAGCAIAGLAAIGIACGNGGDDDDSTVTSTATGPTATSSAPTGTPTRQGNTQIEPDLPAPVSQYSILVQDLGIQNFRTDLSVTETLSIDDYAKSSTFAGQADARKTLEGWGYTGGYRTGLLPEGDSEAILQGGYVVYQELHRYATAQGAHQAFEFLAGNVRKVSGAEVLGLPSFANESIASRGISGKVGKSDIDQVLHQVVFRRGNAVVVVLTIGAEPLMDHTTAYELCAFIDEKMLGERDHPEPTPTPVRSPSPQRTPSPTPTPAP